jgi:hypothetical protein
MAPFMIHKACSMGIFSFFIDMILEAFALNKLHGNEVGHFLMTCNYKFVRYWDALVSPQNGLLVKIVRYIADRGLSFWW